MDVMRPGVSNMAYDEPTDTLYVSFGDHDLTCVGSEDEAGPYVTVQYTWPDESLMGMEVYGLRRNFGSLPLSMKVDARVPFVAELPALS